MRGTPPQVALEEHVRGLLGNDDEARMRCSALSVNRAAAEHDVTHLQGKRETLHT